LVTTVIPFGGGGISYLELRYVTFTPSVGATDGISNNSAGDINVKLHYLVFA